MFFQKGHYKLDENGIQTYILSKKGDEKYLFDKNNQPLFIRDKDNNQIYAKTSEKIEIYPKRGFPFAMNNSGCFYYAKNNVMDEFYPLRNKRNLTIKTKEGEPLFAKDRFFKQIYPVTYSKNRSESLLKCCCEGFICCTQFLTTILLCIK